MQVHLRSGSEGGLLFPESIEDALREAGLKLSHIKESSDPEDPFSRFYRLWIASGSS
jgi:signal recognition particle subunit SEC65